MVYISTYTIYYTYMYMHTIRIYIQYRQIETYNPILKKQTHQSNWEILLFMMLWYRNYFVEYQSILLSIEFVLIIYSYEPQTHIYSYTYKQVLCFMVIQDTTSQSLIMLPIYMKLYYSTSSCCCCCFNYLTIYKGVNACLNFQPSKMMDLFTMNEDNEWVLFSYIIIVERQCTRNIIYDRIIIFKITIILSISFRSLSWVVFCI